MRRHRASTTVPTPQAPDAAVDRETLLLPPPAAARRLTVAVQTLARWRVEGTGPAYVKIGGRVAYPVVDLDAWVAARRFTNTADRRTG